MEEPDLEGHEIVQLIAVDLVHRSEDGERPVHRVVEVGAEGLIGELVHFQAHFDTFEERGGTHRGAMVVATVSVLVGEFGLFFDTAGEGARVRGGVDGEQGVQVVLAAVDFPSATVALERGDHVVVKQDEGAGDFALHLVGDNAGRDVHIPEAIGAGCRHGEGLAAHVEAAELDGHVPVGEGEDHGRPLGLGFPQRVKPLGVEPNAHGILRLHRRKEGLFQGRHLPKRKAVRGGLGVRNRGQKQKSEGKKKESVHGLAMFPQSTSLVRRIDRR